MEQQNGTKVPPASVCHCIISHPRKIQSTQATSLRLVPSSFVFRTEFTSLRIKCLIALTLFSLAASRMSRPRIPFKSKILCRRSDARTCLESLKAPNQALEEQRLKHANKKVRMNSLLNLFEHGKTEDNMQSSNTLKKHIVLYNKQISMIYTRRGNKKGNRNGRKCKRKNC